MKKFLRTFINNNSLFLNMANKRSFKKGQVTIWVIIAIVIVAILIVFLLYKGNRLPGFGRESFSENPEEYLQKCLDPFVKPALQKLGEQGGYLEPAGFVVYNDTKVPYYCYTSEYYKTCVVQQPNIYGLMEKNIAALLKPEVEKCMNELKSDFEARGYEVVMGKTALNVSLSLNKLNLNINSPITLKKEFSKSYREFSLNYNTNMYNLIGIATSIVDYEATYGDSEITLYISYYPDISIEKKILGDSTKVYIVSDVVSKEKIQFASRSLVWPAGYKLT